MCGKALGAQRPTGHSPRTPLTRTSHDGAAEAGKPDPSRWPKATHQAGIIDRTLLPVLQTGQGWADSRKSGYTVTGDIKSNAATFVLHDEGLPIAVLAVCLHSKTSAKLWQWIHSPNVSDSAPPQPAWAALRYDVPETALPPWLDWWAQHVGVALLGREGW